MHPSAAPDRQPVEAIGKDDEIPGAGPGCRWNDEPTCTELPCARCQRLRARARPGQIGQGDAIGYSQLGPQMRDHADEVVLLRAEMKRAVAPPGKTGILALKLGKKAV